MRNENYDKIKFNRITGRVIRVRDDKHEIMGKK